MKLSTKGLNRLKEHEGLRLEAYDDLQPNLKLTSLDDVKGTLTIGYGHTGPDVTIGLRIRPLDAMALLKKDVEWAEEAVERLFEEKGWEFQQNRFDALVSWVYNTGASKLSGRNLVKAIDGLVEAEKKVAEVWQKHYVTSKGKKLKGLQIRRENEANVFLDKKKN